MNAPTAKRFLTQNEIAAHFVAAIAELGDLELPPMAMPAYAFAFAKHALRAKKRVISDSRIFQLRNRISLIAALLPEEDSMLFPLILKIMRKKPTLIESEPQKLAAKLNRLVTLIADHENMFVEHQRGAKNLRSREDIYHYILDTHVNSFLYYSPLTLANYDLYAILCRANEITHEPVKQADGAQVTSLAYLPVKELDRRLAAYAEKQRGKTRPLSGNENITVADCRRERRARNAAKTKAAAP